MAVNRTKVLEAAQKFLSKGQYDKAIAEYQKLVNEDPKDVRTLLKIGDLHTKRNKPKDAIDVYQKVAELYAKQGFFLKAVAVYKQILKLDPAHIDSSQKLAKMYEELALTSDALTTYEQVADAYLAQGQPQKALETMQRMVELDPTNVAARIKLAEALSKAEKPKEAARAFAEGAHLLKEQGRMDDYMRVVERQLYHDPDNLQIARDLSGLYLERQDPKRALAKLQVCFKADPRDVQTLEMLAEAFRQLGQIPKTVSVLKEIARLHQEVGAQEPRKRTLKRVLDLDPNDQEAREGLASAGGAPQTQARTAAAQPAPAAPTAAARTGAQPQPTAPQATQPAAQPAPQQMPRSTLAQPAPAPAQGQRGNTAPQPTPQAPAAPAPQAPNATGPQQMLARGITFGDQKLPERPATLMSSNFQPPKVPAPAPAPAAKLDSNDEIEISQSAEDDLDLLTGDDDFDKEADLLGPESDSDDEVLIVDERAEKDEPTMNAGRLPAQNSTRQAESKQERIARLLSDADAHEGYGLYDKVEALLKQVLDLEHDHVPTHERLKDLYLATDRRVDAVRELLWLSDAWTDKNTERAVQYARAAHDLAPLAAAAKSRLLALGVPLQEESEDVMFVDERSSVAVPMPQAPERQAAKPQAERLERATLARELPSATEDPLDIPISPDEFDIAPPRPRARTVTESSIEDLLARPMTPEDFERMPLRSDDDDDDDEQRPTRAAFDDEQDEMRDLLDAPISPDEFDAPPPRPHTAMNAREMGDMLDKPLPNDDFGLADERFDRSGLIDVDSTEVGDANVLRGGLDKRVERDRSPDRAHALPARANEPSVEFAEIGTGELDVDDRLAPPSGKPRNEGFRELATNDMELVKEDARGLPGPATPAGKRAGSGPDAPPLPGSPAKPKTPARPALADFNASPEATIPGAPIPDLIRQSRVDPQPAAKPAPAPAPKPAPLAAAKMPTAAKAPAPPAAAPAKAPAPPAAAPAKAPAPPPAAKPAPAPVLNDEETPPEIDETIDEAEFFASQGMMEEALELIQEALLIYRGNKALAAKLAEYEAKADAQDEHEEQAKSEKADDESFDIAEQLAVELDDHGAGAPPDEMVDVDVVFAQFKKGVAAQIGIDDSATHFDLGIAYKEMGLTDDAISEFEIASRSLERACIAFTMIGMCHLEKGDASSAVRQFEKALAAPHKSNGEATALHYEIGNAYEQLGDFQKAVSAFEKAAAQDRTFRGVTQRIEQLKRKKPPPPPAPSAEDAEIDAALDDLLGG